MRKRFYSISVLIFISICLIRPIFGTPKSDSLYIKPFQREISTRVLVGIKELSIAIGNSSKLSSSKQIVTYKPNNGIIGGVGVSFRNILLSYYFKLPGTDLNESKFGKTSINDYQVNLTTRYFYFSVFHRSYDGFYVSKPSESYPNWDKEMPYPQRHDITYTTKGIETIINLNPKRYSLNASIKLTEQQLLSVFSGLIYANYSLTGVSADSSLIPSHLKTSFFDGKGLYQTNFSGWTVMPGISYIFVKGRWFLNPIFFTGIGYSQKELLFINDGSERYNDFYFRFSGRLSCGYNNKRLFAGALLEWNDMLLPEENLVIKTENLNVMLMLGFRF